MSMTAARLFAAYLAALPLAAAAQPRPACNAFIDEIHAIFADYKAEAALRLKGKTPRESDLNALRAQILKGDKRASIALVGAGVLERPDIEFRVPDFLFRQVCTMSDHTGLALHAVACAFFMSIDRMVYTPEREKLIARQLDLALERAAAQADAPENERLPNVERRIAVHQACMRERRQKQI